MILPSFQKYENSFIESILSLDQKQKKCFCLSIIERQKYLVEMFDNKYDEKLLTFFDYVLMKGYEIILSNDTDINAIDKLEKVTESKIPDTEDYGASEGSYAQNAIISMAYFLKFVINNSNEYLSYGIEKVLESIDIINYEKDENYSEEFVIKQEIKICKLLIQLLQKDPLDENLIAKAHNWSTTFMIIPSSL